MGRYRCPSCLVPLTRREYLGKLCPTCEQPLSARFRPPPGTRPLRMSLAAYRRWRAVRWSLSFASLAAKLYCIAVLLSLTYVLVDLASDVLLGRLQLYRFTLPPILWVPFVAIGVSLDFLSRFLATAAPAEKGARGFGLIAFVMVLALVCVGFWGWALASVSRGHDVPIMGVQVIGGLLLLSHIVAFGLFLRSAAVAFGDRAMARGVGSWLLCLAVVTAGGAIGWGYLLAMTRLTMDWRGASWATAYVLLIGLAGAAVVLLFWYARLVARVRDVVRQGLACAFV